MPPRPAGSTLFPYTTLFRSGQQQPERDEEGRDEAIHAPRLRQPPCQTVSPAETACVTGKRSGMGVAVTEGDRKSTRLNSSHGSISYAVFCLKKKKKKKQKNH